MKKLLPLLLSALVLSGCVLRSAQEGDGTAYEVYFAVDVDTVGLAASGESGAAVAGELWSPQKGEEVIPGLLDRLLAGPAEPGLCSPFPEDLVLRSWTLENSQLRLDFSEAYEGLSGVDLTLANCCLALTLCQAEGVETVSITVEGAVSPLAAGPLRAEDAVLTGTEGRPVEVNATLWFPRAGGAGLGVEYRRLLLPEGDSLSRAAMEALVQGPSYDTLCPVLPPETEILDVLVEDGVCYVNLPGAALEALSGDPDELRLAVYAIVNTMAGNIETVRAVQLRADGKPAGLPDGLDGPLRPDLSLENAGDA